MEEVIVADEKHGIFVYRSALSCLTRRVEHGWYDEPEDTRARSILGGDDEDAAWKFLLDRNDYEYEFVSIERVL